MWSKAERIIMLEGLRRVFGGDTPLEDIPMPTPYHPRPVDVIELIDAYLDMDSFTVNRMSWEDGRLKSEAEMHAELVAIVDRWAKKTLSLRPAMPKDFIGPLTDKQRQWALIDEVYDELKGDLNRQVRRKAGAMRINKKVTKPGEFVNGVWVEEEFEWEEDRTYDPPPKRRRLKQKPMSQEELMRLAEAIGRLKASQ